MKKFRKLIPAFIMLLVSAILVSTATYAWFSMNTQVNATGMNVKAKAEGGIVISNEEKLAWNANATATHQTTTEVIPTSTANCQSWYHAVSDEFDNAKANQTSDKYVNCSTANGVATNSDGVGIWTKVVAVLFANETEYNAAKGTSLDAAGFAALQDSEKVKTPAVTESIYLLNKFYIKSSADAINATGTKLYINEVVVTGNASSPELDKALRVAVVVDGTPYIFAGFDGATLSYTVAAGSSATVAKAHNTKNVETTITSIPANTTTTPLEVSIYLYFEGEDANCKSSNIKASLDSLNVSVQFGTTQIP